MNSFIKYTLATALLVSTSTCYAEAVKIGVILPLSGPFAQYGARIQRAIAKAAEGTKVRVVYEDEACDAKIALAAYKKLTQIDKVSLLLGPWCGSPQYAVAHQLKSGGQIAVLGSSAPQDIFKTSHGNMFSTQHSIESESTFLAEQMNARGISSTVIIFKENAFSRAHEAAFRKAFKGTIYSTEAYSTDNIADLKSIALKIKQLNPDALYVPDAFPLLNGFTKELAAIGVNKQIYSVYSAQSDEVRNTLGEYGNKFFYSYPAIGTRDALDYFPVAAAAILVRAASSCGNDVACVRAAIVKDNEFDKNGILAGSFVLKTVINGVFAQTP